MKTSLLLCILTLVGATAQAQVRASNQVRDAGRAGPNRGAAHGHGYYGRGGDRGSVGFYRGRYSYPFFGYTGAWGYSPWYDYPYAYSVGAPGYDYYNDGETSNAATGAILGGVAGAIIGNNSGHHNGWGGAAIGAGAGFLLGALSDQNRGGRTVVQQPQSSAVYSNSAGPAPTQTPAPQNVTIINNNYGDASPMSSANSLYGR